MPAATMKKSPSKQKLREIGAAVGSSRRVQRATSTTTERSASTAVATARDVHQKPTSSAPTRIASTTTATTATTSSSSSKSNSTSKATTPTVTLKSPTNATTKALLVLTDPINSPKSTSVAHRKRQEQRHSRRVGSPRKKTSSPRKKKSLDQQKSLSSSSFDFNNNSNYNGFTKEQLAHHEKEVNQLQLNLSRYTRVNDRDLVIRTIKDCRFLKCVPLVETCPAPPSYLVQEAWQTLEQRVQMSSITINGLLFMGSRTNQVIKVLRAMCQELCMGLKLSSGAVYKTLLWRLAQATQNHVVNQATSSSSSASNDETFGELKTLLATSELVLQPVKQRHGQDMIPSSTRLDTPPSLEVYATAGEIQAHVKSFRPYGLCRKVDVATGKKQWILLHVTIQERMNLSTGASTRQARVEVGQQQQQQQASLLLPSSSGAAAH